MAEGLGKVGANTRALAALVAAMARLSLRNPIALIYGLVFPLLFLAGFWAIYRSDPVPLALHAGQFLTVTILGSACFGLPTAMVAEREAGIWRRYRLTATPVWVFVAATILVRLALLLAAVALQLVLATALGMPPPTAPAGLLLVLLVAGLAFLGLGAVIAMLAPNVPAVQAIGQCIFLPMLIIGGVAVPLASLPDWALTASLFLPGRHAVGALQACVTGPGIAGVAFEIAALVATGGAAVVAATGMFRWQPEGAGGGEGAAAGSKLWGLAALTAWASVGAAGLATGRGGLPAAPVVAAEPAVFVREDVVPRAEVAPPFPFAAPPAKPVPEPRPSTPVAAPTPSVSAPVALPQRTVTRWQDVTAAEYARIAFERLPPDRGLVAPIAAEEPDAAVAERIARLSVGLVDWAPAAAPDPVQRVRNLLYVAAVPDLLQMDPFERFVPLLVLEELRKRLPADDLPRLLYWVAMHPQDGDDRALAGLPAGVPAVTGPAGPVRERAMIYALKLLERTRPAAPATAGVRR